MKILTVDSYRDGGTLVIGTDGGEYCIDNRITTTTRGALYFGYPGLASSRLATTTELRQVFALVGNLMVLGLMYESSKH